MEKISQRMFDEFARNLEREMSGGGGGAPAAPEPAEAQGGEEAEGGAAEPAEEPRAEAAPEPETAAPPKPSSDPAGGGEAQALDAMGMFVAPALKKALPYVGPALIGLGYGYLLGRLRELRRR
jgi:hypothetical protein